MGLGTARGGHRTCNAEFSRIRIPITPPLLNRITLLRCGRWVRHQAVNLFNTGSNPVT